MALRKYAETFSHKSAHYTLWFGPDKHPSTQKGCLFYSKRIPNIQVYGHLKRSREVDQLYACPTQTPGISEPAKQQITLLARCPQPLLLSHHMPALRRVLPGSKAKKAFKAKTPRHRLDREATPVSPPCCRGRRICISVLCVYLVRCAFRSMKRPARITFDITAARKLLIFTYSTNYRMWPYLPMPSHLYLGIHLPTQHLPAPTQHPQASRAFI